MTKFINANPASRSRWPTPSCRSPTTSAMGKIIWMLGFSSRANWRNCCTARCWSIWYRLLIATLSFFLAEKLPSVIMTGVESRYFLRTIGDPQMDSEQSQSEMPSRCLQPRHERFLRSHNAADRRAAFVLAVALLFYSAPAMHAQCALARITSGPKVCGATSASEKKVLPEDGYLSTDSYTSKFFGFTLDLPITTDGHRI